MDKIDLNPEEKSGFLIDKKRKQIWQIEMDILMEIINICERHNIKYLVNGGTALGMVRHNGFIPWDDDIDLMMKREDYDRFIEVAKIELKEPYFLQCYKTEKCYYRGHIQVRNSNTTAIISSDNQNNYNKGIWVDIFPIDNVPDDENERELFLNEIKKKKIFISFCQNTYSPNIIKKVFKLLIKYVYWKVFSVDKAIEELEKYATKYNNIKTEYSEIVILLDKFKYKNIWFDSIINMDFEYLKLPIYKDYDEYLKLQYGNDYMEIPKKRISSMHGETFFDIEKSYKEYSKKDINNIINNIKNA